MFLLGLLLGVIWSGLSLLKFFVSPHLAEGTRGRYMVRIAPSTFLLNCFMWYFYMFFHRIFSETKADEQYFQTLMIAFSIYFLTVKIGKEIGSLYTAWKKDTQA